MTGIRIELQLEDGSFTSGVLRANQTLSSFKSELKRLDPHFKSLADRGQDGFRSFKRMDDQSRSLLARLRDITVVGHGVAAVFGTMVGNGNGLISSIVRINAEMERLRFQLAGMSNAADPIADASAQVRNLQEVAKTAPFAFNQITNTMVKMKVAGLDPMNGSLRALLDGVAAFGGTDEALHRITLGITQMSGKGVIQMEELRQQLGESMPAAMKLMARSMGTSIGELTRMIATGRVEASSALGKWFDQVDLSYGGSSNRMMQTFSGQLSRMKTAFVQQVTREGGGTRNAFEALKKTMGDIVTILESPQSAEFFDKLGAGLQKALDMGRAFMGYLTQVKIWLEKIGPLLLWMFGGAVVGQAMAGAMRGINSLRAGIIGVGTASKQATNALRGMSAAAVAAELAQVKAIEKRRRAQITALKGSSKGFAYTDEGMALAQRRTDLQNRASMSSLHRTAGGVSSAFSFAMAGARGLLGMLGPIALGVTILGPLVWDIGKGLVNWATGAKDAQKELSNVLLSLQEVQNRKRQIEKDDLDRQLDNETKGLLDRQRMEREALENRRRDLESINQDTGGRRSDIVEQLAQTNAQIKTLTARHGKEMEDLQQIVEDRRTDLMKKHASLRMEEERQRNERAIEDSRAQVYEMTEAERKAYNARMDEIDEEYKTRLEAEKKAKGSGGRAREWMNDEQRKAEVAILEARRKATEATIEQAEADVAAGRISHEVLQQRRKDLEELDERIEKTRNKKYAIDLLDAPESEEKKIERLVRFTEDAKEKVKNLSAELNGASGKVAQLMYQIKRGDFGNLSEGTREAEELRYQLVEATVAAEALDEIMKSSDKKTKELESQADKVAEEIARIRAIQNSGLDPNDPDFDAKLALYQYEQGINGFGQTVEEKMLSALSKVTEGVNGVVGSFNQVNDILRNRAFSEENVAKIDTMTAAVQRLASAAGLVASGFQGLSGFNLGGIMGQVGGMIGSPAGLGAIKGSVSGAAVIDGLMKRGLPQYIADAFALNLKDESGLNPGINEANPLVKGSRGGFGLAQWTGKRRKQLEEFAANRGLPLADMNTQLDFLVQELFGSESAAGRAIFATGNVADAAVAILTQFLRPAAEHQASRSAKYRNAQGTYEGLTPESQQALKDGATGAVNAENSQADRLRDNLDEIAPLRIEEAMREMRQELENGIKAASESEADPETGTAEKKLISAILDGKLDPGNRDQNSAAYTELRDLARKQDKLTETAKEHRKDEAEIQRAEEKLLDKQLETAERVAAAKGKLDDPNHRGMSRDLINLEKSERDYLDAVQRRYGKESDEYLAAQKKMADARKQLQSAEGAEALLELKTRSDEAEKAAMTERERRRADHQEELRQLQAERDAAIAAGQDKAIANAIYERGRLALTRQYARESQTALAQQVEQMGRLGDNMRQTASGWVGSLSQALYDQDWTTLGNTIREGIARSLTDKSASLIMKPFMQMLEGADGQSGLFGFIDGFVNKITESIAKATGSTGGGGGFLSSMFSWVGQLFGFGTAHTGAIVGVGGGGYTRASVADFIGAPKFHTGGVIGGRGRFSGNLTHDEVPIIAKKGEGVFTPDQMKHLGGTMVRGGDIAIAPTINVNASGGTPEQNADLARQISAETERSMRALVRDEMVRQHRTGNMLSKR